jgi:carbon-monoxide dehydrogenase medium subunit
MYEFNYHQPASLDEVARLLGADEDAKIVAGGMTLIPTLKQRLAKPSDLVDLAKIDSLRGIREEGDALVIGAMTRHVDVERSPVVKRAIPALAELAGLISARGGGEPPVIGDDVRVVMVRERQIEAIIDRLKKLRREL